MKSLLLFSLLLAFAAAGAAPEKSSDPRHEENLARIPTTDPEPTAIPSLKDGMKGTHPRLLFTKQEIEALKAQIAADPILKRTAEETLAWSKRFKCPTDAKPAIVLQDTPALSTSNGSYPALAYAYALDPNPALLQEITNVLTMMLNQPYWADTAELDSNMGAACNMLMTALLFDTVYNDLDPEFRAKVAEKLLLHARRLYYLGHKQLCLMPIKYWQQDPQPNHRWYRARGLAACLLAVADEPNLNTGYLMQQLKEEMDFLMKWYPSDGDCHEGSGYQQFGFRSLADTASMMDRVLGTEYLKNPGFQNAWAQQLYYWVPGRGSNIGFGDDMNGIRPFGYDDAAFFISPHLSRDKNVQAALRRRFLKMAVTYNDRPYVYPWSMLAYYDASVGEGDYKALPTHRLFPDIGAATMRDSWEDNAVIFTFKCGPYGGYALNEYRHANLKNGKPHYVNIAHDDPDANSFALSVADDFMFQPGFYSLKKTTESQNSITVDGKGQINEGSDFTQPTPERDMRELSYLTGWKAGEDGRIIIEGEAGAAYQDDALKQFRRTAIWMPGEYLVLLDNIAGNGPHRITWRGAVEKGMFEKPEDGLCYISTKKGNRMDFQILSNREFKGLVDHLFLDGRFGSALMQQFQFFIDTESVKFATLFDPWKKKPVLFMKEEGGTVTLTVKTASFEDTWKWENPSDAHTPSTITGTRGNSSLIALTSGDKPPTH